MMALLIIVMIAVAALALDVGRLLVLRSEMHNAVDEAALAAAAELDGSNNAQSRAKHAAMTLIENDSHFSKVRELIGTNLTEGQEISFTFFCAIENDALASNLSQECVNSNINDGGPDTNKYLAQGDADSHYIRVTLNPVVTQGSDDARYSIDLYFLPILRTLGLNVPTEASTTATALAGRAVRICDYPPLMICNPYEGTNNSLTVGQQLRLFMGAGDPQYWVPGDFGLLESPTGGGGATDISKNLAGPGLTCSDPFITTKTGVNANMVKWGLNTRFGIYEHGYQAKDYPPSPDVLDYPLDVNLQNDSNARVGTGQWETNPSWYWNNYQHASAMPIGLSSRYDYYSWEINNSDYPTKIVAPPVSSQCNPIANGCNRNTTIWKGEPYPANYVADTKRRVITVPVLNCSTLPKNGGKISNLWVADQNVWKKFFITDHVDDPSATGGLQILAEYLGGVGNGDGTYRVEVKLYE